MLLSLDIEAAFPWTSQGWLKASVATIGAPQKVEAFAAPLSMLHASVEAAGLGRACADDGVVGCGDARVTPAVAQALEVVDGGTGMAVHPTKAVLVPIVAPEAFDDTSVALRGALLAHARLLGHIARSSPRAGSWA